MRRKSRLFVLSSILVIIIFLFNNLSAQTISKAKTMEAMVLANKYFMEKWPDAGKEIMTDRVRPSNIWTRAVYYEGLMALYKIKPDTAYLNYAIRWG